jgi:DHA2 family multidrug resistance protein
VHQHWRIMLAVVPGLAMTALHSTMLDLPRADVIDALDSDHYRIQWIIGAYIVGTAAGMALTKFIGDRLGLRWTYLLGVACFTVAGGLCAAVSEVIWMAPLRLVQGYGDGLIICAGMVIIWREFPVRKELAMALYAMGVFVPSLAGAPLGGLLTASFSWRLIFLGDLPLGLLTGAAAWWLLPRDRPATPDTQPLDLFGLLLLLSWVTTLNVVLDMGQYWGWLNSPFFVPWFVGLALSLAGFIAWGVWASRPLINLRPLGIRSFALGLGIRVLLAINLFVLISLLSGYMINLRGYQWWQGSLVLLPALATMVLTVLGGAAWGTTGNRKARLLVGLGVMTLTTWLLADIDMYTAKGWQALHMALWGAGAGLVIGPALLTAFEGLTNEETLHTAGVFNILRSLPAFLVGGVLATLLTQRTDANFDVLRQNIRYNRPIVAEALRDPEHHFIQRGSPNTVAGKQAHAVLGQWVHANARAFAFQNVLQILALVPAAGIILVLLIRLPHDPQGDERSSSSRG